MIARDQQVVMTMVMITVAGVLKAGKERIALRVRDLAHFFYFVGVDNPVSLFEVYYMIHASKIRLTYMIHASNEECCPICFM